MVSSDIVYGASRELSNIIYSILIGKENFWKNQM